MAAETAYTDAAAGEAASGGLPQFAFDTWASQIFWLVITFGVLYFVLARFILPKIDQGLTNRGDRIADDLDEAARMNEEAVRAEADYTKSVNDAKAKAHNISEATRKSIDAEIDAEVAEAELEFSRKQAEADARIADIKAKAMANVDGVANDTVTAILDKIAGVKVSAAKIKSAVSSAKG